MDKKKNPLAASLPAIFTVIRVRDYNRERIPLVPAIKSAGLTLISSHSSN